MSDANRLLELIEESVVSIGGDLGGWTRRTDGELQLFDGRVTLRAELKDDDPSATGDAVHAHVLTTLHEYDGEVLDACLLGAGGGRDAALGEAAYIWIVGVAGPIRSFLDDKPVCMTCQAGDASEGYSRGDYGLPGLRAYVGPSFSRGFDDGNVRSALDDTKPWFRFAAESAGPRRVHVAKAFVTSKGAGGWSRALEVDGHDVSHHDPDWPADVRGPDSGFQMRFAVFEFPRDSPELVRRAELERTIRHFAADFSRYDSIDRLKDAMVSEGFDPDLIHETESISTIAFGRTFFEPLGLQYQPTVIRARRDGRVETDVPLMSIPAYTRALALAAQLRETMTPDDFQKLCLYNAESVSIMMTVNAINAAGAKVDPARIRMYPPIASDCDVSDETMDAAVAVVQNLMARNRAAGRKKTWWKF
jgi:hypothetical protein